MICAKHLFCHEGKPLIRLPTRCYNRLYMALSFLRKIQKILEKPVPPAHIRERNIQVIIPWHERFWREIRPPQAVASTREPMRPKQRRMVWMFLAAVAMVGTAVWAVNYLSEAPARADAAYQRGMDRLGPGDYAGAIAQFSESIRVKETAAAFLERANAHKTLGHAQEALTDWARAIQIDPNLAPAFAARGTHYRVAGELSRALADLDHSVQIAPTVDALYQRGQTYHALGQFQKAVDDFSEAISLRRESPYIYLSRSLSRKALGDEAGYREDQDTAVGLQHGSDDR